MFKSSSNPLLSALPIGAEKPMFTGSATNILLLDASKNATVPFMPKYSNLAPTSNESLYSKPNESPLASVPLSVKKPSE